MNWGAFLLLSGFIILALLLVQRTESKRRRLAIILTVIVGFLLWYWSGIRELRSEFGYSLLCGGLFSGLFWVLIGRYNPVADSDETIQVLGMDD